MKKILCTILIAVLMFAPLQATIVHADQCSAVNSDSLYIACCTGQSSQDSITCQNYALADAKSAGAPQCANITNTTTYNNCCNGNSNDSAMCQAYASYGKQATFTPPTVTTLAGQKADGSFGGITFKGVGSALLQCTGVGDVVASALERIKEKVGEYVQKGITAVADLHIPVVSSIAGLFTSKPPVPGVDPSHPSYVKDSALENQAQCLDGIAYVMSQQVLQQITNRTLNWANTGFAGNPLYIKDIDSYMKSISNQKINDYLQGTQANNPIFGNALKSVITQQLTGKADGRIDQALSTPQAVAYGNFTKDFTQGGWGSLLNPANNPLGAFFNATDTISQNVSTQQQNSKAELQRNAGFLDMKKCANPNEQICTKYETVTPGSIIAQQVSSVTNSPQQQAQLATHFNQAVGSFFDGLLNNLFNEGLSSLKSNTQTVNINNSGGVGSNTVIGSDGKILPGVNANVFGLDDLNKAANASSTIDISHPQLLRAVLQTQKDYLVHTSDSRVILNRLVPELGQLDYCVPGPNPTWQTDLSQNVDSYISNISTSGHSGVAVFTNTNLSLLDKVTGENKLIADRTLPIYGASKATMQTILDTLSAEFNTKFSRTALGDAYANTATTAANQTFARGMAQGMYDEVNNLPTYVNGAITTDQQYSQSIATAQSNIRALQSIHSQILTIVATAKARYIKQQAAAGTPVNLQCINDAYVIDTTPVIAPPLQETTGTNATTQQSIASNAYFYNSL